MLLPENTISARLPPTVQRVPAYPWQFVAMAPALMACLMAPLRSEGPGPVLDQGRLHWPQISSVWLCAAFEGQFHRFCSKCQHNFDLIYNGNSLRGLNVSDVHCESL